MNCLFCKITNNEILSYTIYEDEKIKCFLDIQPESNGHLLIIPKKHYQDLMDIDEQTILHIFYNSKKMKTLLENKLKCDGLSLIQNNGSKQEIKHYHLHLIPHYKQKQKITNIEEIYNKLK